MEMVYQMIKGHSKKTITRDVFDIPLVFQLLIGKSVLIEPFSHISAIFNCYDFFSTANSLLIV